MITSPTAPSKAVRTWMIALQVLVALGVLIALFGAINALGGLVMATVSRDNTVSSQSMGSGLMYGLGYLIPPGLNLAAWLVYRRGRGGAAIGLMVACLLTCGCALIFFGFEILRMFV